MLSRQATGLLRRSTGLIQVEVVAGYGQQAHASSSRHGLFHTSATLSRKAVVRPSEKVVMAEIRELKQQIEIQKKEEESKEKESRLPPLTEDTLALLYEAINMPEPATTEDIRQEQMRRHRLLESNTARGTQGDFRRRLEEIQHRLEGFKSKNEADQELDEQDQTIQLQRILRRFHDEVNNYEPVLADSDQSGLPQRAISASPSIDPVQDILSRLQETLKVLNVNSTTPSSVPLGVLSGQEWESMAKWSALHNDRQALVSILQSMQQQGHADQRTAVANAALNELAVRGEVDGCHDLLAVMRANQIELDGQTNHCLIKAHTKADRLDEAIAMLTSLEQVQPAEMKTYAMVIERLLTFAHLPAVQSRAWSVFQQMRRAAHPVPDSLLYATMIKACALGVPQVDEHIWKPQSQLLAETRTPSQKQFMKLPRKAEPDVERALDLFREMTLRYGVRPTPEVYAAVILACMRRKDTYRKGIDLFQSMLELERQRIASIDAASLEDETIYTPTYAPDRETYNAVLQGCADNGDLLRARWILAEMLRSSLALWTTLQGRTDVPRWKWKEVERRRPDEKSVALVFFAYANYKVPAAAQVKTELGGSGSQSNEKASLQPNREQAKDAQFNVVEQQEIGTTFGERLPQSRSDVLAEVDGLIERIAIDMGVHGGLLSAVKPHPYLLNAYLSVLSKHCKGPDRLQRIEAAVFGSDQESAEHVISSDDAGDQTDVPDSRSLFTRFDVPINGNTCEIVLSACCDACSSERAMADALADRIWGVFSKLSLTPSSPSYGDGTDVVRAPVVSMRRPNALRISQCWALMIHNLAKSNHLTEAMSLLRAFVRQYRTPKDGALRRQSSRMPGRMERPALTFSQLSLLHERLIMTNDRKYHADIGFITAICKAYEAFLQPRKPAVLRFRPPERSIRHV